jgi:hypothetical protein
MSHIQGQTHLVGMTEHLDYVRVDVDNQGFPFQVAVVTHHAIGGLNLRQEVTVYWQDPGTGQRDLAAVLSATRRTALLGILDALVRAATLADTPTDPAPRLV